MAKEIGWELYRSFLAVLKEGSLSGAARALGITQPTVGRHVGALEVAFGQALFTRSQLGLLPTDAAVALREYAESMQRTAAALQRAATTQPGAAVSGTVRVSASEVIGVEVLPQALARLRRDHPGLRVELVATNRIQDLLQREVDIAVRMTPPAQDQLIARRVGKVELGLFARADYLRRHGAPGQLADLAHHSLIGFDEATAFLRAASARLPSWTRDGFSLRTDSDLAQLALIKAGGGIGFCQAALARRDKRLVRVLPSQVAFTLDTWVTMHEGLRAIPRFKVTFDALVACLEAHTGHGHNGVSA